jgi:hypothetical protein
MKKLVFCILLFLFAFPLDLLAGGKMGGSVHVNSYYRKDNLPRIGEHQERLARLHWMAVQILFGLQRITKS